MTMQEAVQKAIENGWSKFYCSNCMEPWIGHKPTRIGNRYCTKYPDLQYMVLDPEFWKALGKSLGWGACSLKHADIRTPDLCYCNAAAWHKEWHDFIDHLALGGTIEEYFANL